MRIVGFTVLLAAFAAAASAQIPSLGPEGMPFGHISDADIDRLQDFALTRGFDLKAEMARIYGEKKVDEDALARVFVFSRQFSALDKNARSYGQIIYSALLILGETTDAYWKVLDRQPADVQQRVRDFLYYPMLRLPKEQRKRIETDKPYQTLFPRNFQFGHDDPVFANET